MLIYSFSFLSLYVLPSDSLPNRLHIEPFSLRISFSVKYVRMRMFYIKTSNRFLYILLIIRMYCFAKRVLLQQHHLLLWICVVFHKQKHIFCLLRTISYIYLSLIDSHKTKYKKQKHKKQQNKKTVLKRVDSKYRSISYKDTQSG